MKVEITSEGNSQKQISFLIPPADVQVEVRKAYDRLASSVRLPGFRQGKAPRRILEAKFADRVHADVADQLMQRSWTSALSEHEIEPVARPEVSETGDVQDSQGFAFTLKVEVRPEIELSKWTDLEVEVPAVDVLDEEINLAVNAQLERQAKFETVTDRATRANDMVMVEAAFNDGEQEVHREEGTMIRLDGDPYLPGIESVLVDRKADESFEAEVAFADDARTAAVAGRTLTVRAKILSIQAHEVPELNDEVAKTLGYEDGADAMRTALRTQLHDRKTQLAQNQARANVLEAIIESNPFDVPTGMIDQSHGMLLNELRSQRAMQTGQDPKTIGFSQEEVDSLRGRAVFAAKAGLILPWVAEKQTLEATDEDVQARIQEIADSPRAERRGGRFLVRKRRWHSRASRAHPRGEDPRLASKPRQQDRGAEDRQGYSEETGEKSRKIYESCIRRFRFGSFGTRHWRSQEGAGHRRARRQPPSDSRG